MANSGGAAPGDLIGNIGGRTGDGTKLYYVVLDNTGTNLVYANKTNVILRFVPPQGFVTANGTNGFLFKDESLANIVDHFHTTLGYGWTRMTSNCSPTAMCLYLARRCARST